MRIGIDARMYGGAFTGIGRYTQQLIDHLLALDSSHEYVIFLRQTEYDEFRPPHSRVSKVLADFSHYSVAEQTGFLHLLNAQELDLMHFTHFNAPLFYRRPFVVTIHDLTLSYFPGKKMTHFFHRFAYQCVIRSVLRRAKAIIAVSFHTKTDLQHLFNVPDLKIHVFYHGLSPDFGLTSAVEVERVKKKYGLDRPYFLYTGVWRDHKNVVGMIRGFTSFIQKSDSFFDLVMTGKEDPCYSLDVRNAIHADVIHDRVHPVGLVPEEDLRALYKATFAYIFPSFYEGFGFPPLEAMQCGVPVLASHSSSIPEICGKGNALYFDPYDTDDLSEKIRTLAENEPLRHHLIQRGLSHVRSFRWDDMAKKVLRLYNDVLYGTD